MFAMQDGCGGLQARYSSARLVQVSSRIVLKPPSAVGNNPSAAVAKTGTRTILLGRRT